MPSFPNKGMEQRLRRKCLGYRVSAFGPGRGKYPALDGTLERDEGLVNTKC